MKTFIYDIFNNDVPGFIHRVKVIHVSSQAVINIKSVIFTMWKLQAAIYCKQRPKFERNMSKNKENVMNRKFNFFNVRYGIYASHSWKYQTTCHLNDGLEILIVQV